VTTPATSYLYDDGHHPTTDALFGGDEGTLGEDQRRALVVLLKQRFITSRTHPAEWEALMSDVRAIRSRLHDLFLELEVDTEREVAYKKQVVTEGGGRQYPTLLYDSVWSREETILMVYLRTKARAEQAGGVSRAYVDRDDMLDYIRQHRPDRATDKAADERRAAKSVEALFTAGLLLGRSDGDRYEISPAIESLLSVEKLESLHAWLRSRNSAGSDSPTVADTVTDTEDGTE
jgi:hypothetical protein